MSQFLLRLCCKGFVVAVIALDSTFVTVNAAEAPLPEQGPTASPVQSPARPHGFQIRGPVMLAGSDARSAHFTNDYLQPIFQQASAIVKSNVAFGARSDHKLDASKLFLLRTTKYPVRVYFIAEGAGYHNSLGYSVSLAGDNNGGQKRLLFPDCSSPRKNGNTISVTGFLKRTTWEPLHPGDFVEMGHMLAGTQLDFFLVRDGARGNNHIFTNHDKDNPDKIQHLFAMAIPNSPFLLIGFEDLYGGGDLDFEDVLFVVDIGLENIKGFEEVQLPN